tara:strand:+ start:2976 stop:3404 length:429 start_codon:yes stop_codon:yes gene_type:complete
MSTIDDRAAGIRGKLQERSGGIRSELTSRRQALAQGLIRDLSQIITRQTEPPTLRREEPRGGIPSARGYAQYNYQPGSSTGPGGGIASPLEEVSYSNRLYHTNGIPSTDGLFIYPLLSRLQLEDANGDPVEIYFAGASAPTP